MPIEFFQITAAYSNAMLVAIMPHISDFAKKLNLPTSQPVNISQVRRFNCFPRSDHIGGRVILTNGCAFIFDHGRVENFESSYSYYYLQDPDLIPKFYGPVKLTETQALQIAHQAIKKLGYTDAMLSADMSPQITPPPKKGSHFVPRYRIRWYDPTRGHDPNNPPLSVEFEVDATTGQIQMLNILNPNTHRLDLKLNVRPTVVDAVPKSVPVGPGRKIYPVSETYSNAFLIAILPQCSSYAKTVGLSIKQPITVNLVDRAKYLCGLVDADPMASITLTNGTRFDYRHGQVIAFYAPDVMQLPGRDISHSPTDYENFQSRFYGPINMTTNEALALVRQTVNKLGYSEKVLHIDQPPCFFNDPGWWGTNRIARCFVEWRESIDGPAYVNAEVDVAKRTLKSLYINDHAITNIWREPPKVDVAINPEK